MVSWNTIRLIIAITCFIGVIVLMVYSRILERKLEIATQQTAAASVAVQTLANLLIEAGMKESDLKLILEHELKKQKHRGDGP